jgi:MtN3 and saliva related transmembrane protein
MFSVEHIGIVAGFLTTTAFIPQVWKIWRTRTANDISYGMFAMFTFGVLLWLVYGILINAPSIILANGITFVLASLVIALKVYFEVGGGEI